MQKSIKTAIAKRSVAWNLFRYIHYRIQYNIIFVSTIKAFNEKYLFFDAINALSLTLINRYTKIRTKLTVLRDIRSEKLDLLRFDGKI